MDKPVIEIRSSSWADLLDCSLRWYAVHILGMTRPASVPAHMGTSIHHGTAVYDTDRAGGREGRLSDAVDAAMDRFDRPFEDVHWTADDYSKRDARAITIKATQAYCETLAPQFDYTAVELRPNPLDIDVEGVIIRISGQMDRTRVRKGEGPGVGISDLKTGKRIVNSRGQADTRGKKFQIGIYELLAEHSLGQDVNLPGMIAGVTTTQKPRTGVGEISGAKDLMLGTEEEPGIIETAGAMVKQGLFPPNPTSNLCSEKFCPYWDRCKAR